MKTYNFRVVVEPDEDFDGNRSGWHAYCPRPGTTWGINVGHYESEALEKLNGVIRMVVDSMVEHGERLPEEPIDQVEVTVEPHVAVTV